MPYPAFILPGILLALGFIAAMAKLMGAGDIKLVCALAVALSVPETGNFLLLTAIAGYSRRHCQPALFLFLRPRGTRDGAICAGHQLRVLATAVGITIGECMFKKVKNGLRHYLSAEHGVAAMEFSMVFIPFIISILLLPYVPGGLYFLGARSDYRRVGAYSGDHQSARQLSAIFQRRNQ